MISLSKEESLHKISLRKKSVVSLAKERDLDSVRARVALVLDKSVSMDNLFRDGTVQDIIERIIPLALNFDDNGELDLWLFSDYAKRLDGVTLDNFYGLAEEIHEEYHLNGTNYAPVMLDIAKYYIDKEPMQIPNYVIFVTDGDNWDKEITENVITQLSHFPIFWQFVGIGHSSFSFLERLDTMTSRYVDNANFFEANDIGYLSDDDLYDKLLGEFPHWLKLSEVQTMLCTYKKLKLPLHLKIVNFLDKLGAIYKGVYY